MLLRVRQALLLLVISVSMSATAFAHRLPLPQDDGLRLALSMGATAADLCSSDADGGALPGLSCLACHIVGSAGLPGPTDVGTDLALAVERPWLAPQARHGAERPRDPAHGPQGPPAA